MLVLNSMLMLIKTFGVFMGHIDVWTVLFAGVFDTLMPERKCWFVGKWCLVENVAVL